MAHFMYKGLSRARIVLGAPAAGHCAFSGSIHHQRIQSFGIKLDAKVFFALSNLGVLNNDLIVLVLSRAAGLSALQLFESLL